MESGGKCVIGCVIYILFCLYNFITCGSSYYLVNVARGKPASQSSDYIGKQTYGDKEGFNYSAALAVDGNNSTNFHDNSCSSTDSGQKIAWWEVDLKGIYNITKINIFQRTDAYAERDVGSVITGIFENGADTELGRITISVSSVVSINIPSGNRFTAIRISNGDLLLPAKDVFLCLCEVEVFAAIMCPLPPRKPDNSQLNSTNGIAGKWSYRSMLTITCDHGYNLIGDRDIQCAENGQWSPSNFGRCSAIMCPLIPRQPDNSQLNSTNGIAGRWSYMSMLTITCDHGYNLIGDRAIQCADNGQWNPSFFGRCSAIMCPSAPGKPDNSQLNSTNGIAGIWSYRSMLTITCDHGYNLIGDRTIQCAENGQWSPSNFGRCSVKRCDKLPPQVAHGILTFENGIEGNGTYNTTVSLNCTEGYKRDSHDHLRCADENQWQGSLGVCLVKRCDKQPPKVAHGILTFENGIEGNGTYNTKVSLNCTEGYKRDSNDQLHCADEDQWQGSLGLCMVKRCVKLPPQVAHGILTFENGVEGNGTYNTTVSVNCTEGYKRDSDHQLRCADEDQWQGSLSVCLGAPSGPEVKSAHRSGSLLIHLHLPGFKTQAQLMWIHENSCQ